VSAPFGFGSPARAESFVPTSFGGSLSYNYGYNRVESGESEIAALVLAMNMGGYIWEPWFMTSSFGLSLGLAESDNTQDTGTVSKTVGGSVDMTLFPISRFPTSFGFSLTDSRQELREEPAVSGQDYQIRRFYLRQLYNSPLGYTVSAYYNQSSVVISDQNDEALDRSFGIQARRRFSYHDFEFDMNYFVNEPSNTPVEYKTLNVLLSHNYFPSAETGVNSLANYSTSDTTGDAAATQFSYEQLSSSFYWRPEHRPYFISGGVRVFQIDTSSTSRGVSTNANATYRVTRNFTVGASINVNVADADGVQSTDSTQAVNAEYFSDSFDIAGFDYGWSANTSFSNSVSRSDKTEGGAESDQPDDSQAVGVALSHRLSRVWSLGRYSSLTFGVGQGASANKISTSDEVPINVSNSASSGWSSYAYGGTTTLNVSVSDSRSYSERESNFQVASVQLGRNQEISRLSSLAGSANFQTSRSTSVIDPETNETDTQSSKSANAALNYSHARFFGIHNLSFNSQLVFPSLLGSETNSVQSTAEWTNTWTFQVGLLQSTLIIRTQELGSGERAYSGSFTAIRTF
jgi:hypothetical protein